MAIALNTSIIATIPWYETTWDWLIWQMRKNKQYRFILRVQSIKISPGNLIIFFPGGMKAYVISPEVAVTTKPMVKFPNPAPGICSVIATKWTGFKPGWLLRRELAKLVANSLP